jgi:signal transduction histidine kinase/DNA-binding response OmpR family regulator
MIRIELPAHLRTPAQVGPPSQQRKHKGSILVIEGEHASLKPLFTILTEDGYAVHELQLDLESQLRFVKDLLPDLMLVDVRNPGMDGYQVCASLKNDPITRAIPVIFISSIDRSINQAKALLSGAVDYVTDPFDAQEVLWRIETHISLRRLRETLESADCSHSAQHVMPNEDLERAFREIHTLTRVTGRKHAEEKVRQAARELKFRAEVGAALSKPVSTREMLQECAEAIVRRLDAAFARIWTSNCQETMLELQASAGMYTRLNGTYGRIHFGDLKVGRIASEKKPHLTNDVLTDPRIRNKEWVRSCGMVSFAGYPLVVEKRAVGVMAMFARHPLSDDTLDTLAAVADAVAQGIERKRAEAELRRSEAYLAEAQRLSSIGSFAWRVATDEITWSEQLYRIFEIKIGEPVTLELIRSRVHPEDVSLLETMKMVHEAGGRVTDFEWHYRLLMPNRSIKYLHAVAHATRDQDDQLEYIAAVQDVTESKVAEEALNRARSELVHMARVTTLSALTASIAHEVNQPISAVTTSAGACLRWLNRDQPEVQRAREAAMRIEEDGKRAAEIIGHLKSLYKKDVSAQRTMVSVNELVGEMLMLLHSEADRHSVVMRTELAADLPSVSADRVQLQQVLMNLMLNGMEAMSEGGGELKISTGRDARELLVSVSDTGVGIPADKMKEIFNAFVTTKTEGIGMGLAISSTIIESHGGRLWPTANPGGGATFKFTLPTDPEG